MHEQHSAFENIVGKGEIARNEQFLLFPQCFLLNQIIESPFVHIFDVVSLFAAELDEPKITISGEGFTPLFVSWLSHTWIDTTNVSKAASYFSLTLSQATNFRHL